jgi:hypothetical protein
MVFPGIFLTLLLCTFSQMHRKYSEFRYPVLAGAFLLFNFWSMSAIVLPIVRYMVPVLSLMPVFFPAMLEDKKKRPV